MATFTDNFNRTGPGLGANWTTNTGSIVIDADNTRARGGTSGVDGLVRANSITPGNDQEAQVTISNISDDQIGPAVYVDTTGAYTMYSVMGTTTATDLFKVVAGTYTSLETLGAGVANGDVLKITVTRVATTNTIKAWKNGTQLGTTKTDTAISPGGVGMYAFASSADSTSSSATDFSGGDSGSVDPYPERYTYRQRANKWRG